MLAKLIDDAGFAQAPPGACASSVVAQNVSARAAVAWIRDGKRPAGVPTAAGDNVILGTLRKESTTIRNT